jgi:pimeloyl-ACP methyl ester carboxylesterase
VNQGKALITRINTIMTKILVALHGWGGSKESWNELQSALGGSDVKMYTVDLPGFGNEPDPNTPYSVDDYADWVITWITNNVPESAVQPISLIGHSHGGRISIVLAHRQSTGTTLPFTIEHLYLCAAAGIRHPRHFKRIVGISLAKTGKVFLRIPGLSALAPLAKKLLYKLVRVHDYERASIVMQTTLQRVSKQDLRNLLPAITIPTDLFWGTADGMTPYSDALYMQVHIPNARLHTFSGVRHAVHRVEAKAIALVITTT